MEIVGTDVSKGKLDSSLLTDPSLKKTKDKVSENTLAGFRALLEWASKCLN